MIKAVMFDLDGTLLPMDENKFVKGYLSLIGDYMTKYGFNKDELIHDILAFTNLMTNNDGSKTNYDVFWEAFAKKYSNEKLSEISHFDEFYTTDFKKTKAYCGENPYARQTIDFCKEHNLKLILATSPFFPKVGVVTRLEFVGLNETDFDYITSYENAHYSKQNPKYYEEILQNTNLNPDEVIYFGDGEVQDFENASKVNIKSFLISNETDEENLVAKIPFSKVIDTLKSVL